MATQTKIKTKASDMFVLAILAYLLTLVSPFLDGFGLQKSIVVALILRAVCIAAWIFGAWGLVKIAKKECGFTVIDKENKPTALQWILTSIITVLFVAYCVFDGIVELSISIGSLKDVTSYLIFITYYLVNAAQALIIALIVIFAQKACDLAFGLGKYIPWGGIVLGLCWAAASLLGSVGIMFPSFETVLVPALWSLAYGIVFGVIYLLSGKKAIYALPFMAIAFVLM